MSVWYLELDDEITDAVARVRAAKDDRAVLVVPPGSRIGTGRINFRLLAREALGRGIGIAVVSGDAQVRALASSAGLATFRTVSETETVGRDRLVPRDDTGAPTDEHPSIAGPTSSTAPGPAGAASVAVATTSATHGRSAQAPARRRSIPRRAKVAGASVALAVTVSGGLLYGAFVTIPRASIWLTQTAHDVGPTTYQLQVIADAPTDAAKGVIRGTWLPVSATGPATVTATGDAEPLVDRASGIVTFTNHSVNPIPVPDLTSVQTASGVEFLTQGLQFVAPSGSTDIAIKAAQAGPQGNVPAGAVTVMPVDLKRSLNNGTVVNKEPTDGGSSKPQHVILEADFEEARTALQTQVEQQLRQQATDPVGLPVGSVAYAETVQPGTLVIDPAQEDVVGQPVESMSITGTMTGQVLTASIADIRQVATQKLQADSGDATFVTGSIHVTESPPTVGPDGSITYQATASGSAYDTTVDPKALVQLVRGKTVSEAHLILDQYGEVTIQLSPDFLPSLPDDPNRIVLNLTTFRTPAP